MSCVLWCLRYSTVPVWWEWWEEMWEEMGVACNLACVACAVPFTVVLPGSLF